MIDNLDIKNCVYVIRCPSHKKGLYKIGCTSDLKRRLAELYNTSTPEEFEILAVIQTNQYNEFEDILHTYFQSCRVNPRREFFNFCDIFGRNYIKSNLKKIKNLSAGFKAKFYDEKYFKNKTTDLLVIGCNLSNVAKNELNKINYFKNKPTTVKIISSSFEDFLE